MEPPSLVWVRILEIRSLISCAVNWYRGETVITVASCIYHKIAKYGVVYWRSSFHEILLRVTWSLFKVSLTI